MIDALQLGFLQNALVGGLLVSLICGLLSSFIVLRRLAFIGAGISHSAFGGVALGFLLQLDPFWTGLGFAIAVGFLIEWIQSRGRIPEDTAIGIFFAAAMAIGVIFLHYSSTYNADVFGILFGNILAIGPKQLYQVLAVAVVVLGFLACFYKELVFISFDEETAWICGLPVALLRYLFLGILSLTIIVSIYLVGIILVSALLVIPAAIARQFTKRLHLMVGGAALVAVLATIGGLALSFWIDLPSGAAIVMLLTLLFLGTAGWRPRR